MRTYDTHQRGSINFDNFIQCCVLLKSLTDQFRMRDTQQNGTIRIQYEEVGLICENLGLNVQIARSFLGQLNIGWSWWITGYYFQLTLYDDITAQYWIAESTNQRSQASSFTEAVKKQFGYSRVLQLSNHNLINISYLIIN